MGHTYPKLSRLGLTRPRLLPATIAAMSALIAVKTAIMVEAMAGEAVPSAPANTVATQNASRTVPPNDTTDRPTSSPHVQDVTPKSYAPSPPVSEAERTILMALRHRRVVLDDRAHELDLREAEISAADRRLGDRVQQLSQLQAKLETLEASRQRHSDENWVGLVKVYEAMKPRDAASIFESLDMQVLLQVIDRMQDRRAAPVLAAMQPDRARLVTQMLAEMRTRTTTLK